MLELRIKLWRMKLHGDMLNDTNLYLQACPVFHVSFSSGVVRLFTCRNTLVEAGKIMA